MSTGEGGEQEYDPYDDAPEWTDEDEERYQARQTEERRRKKIRRRQALSFSVLVLVVLGAGLAGAGVNQGWWEWPFSSSPDDTTTDCSEVEPTIAAPADVRVNVLNATEIRGLAAAVSTELRKRGYVVEAVGNDESGIAVTESAQVRHGPDLAAEAASVAVQVPGAVLVDDGRTGEVVDIVLGAGYRNVTNVSQAAAAIAAAAPTQPAGCAPTAGD